MFVLVTGGAGFIGSHTVELLLSAGAKVRILDNLTGGNRNNLPKQHARMEFVSGDVCDAECVRHCINGVTHVLHLAAQISVPFSISEPTHSGSINIGGYLNVLDAARTERISRVVHASSAAVYGWPESLPLIEETPTRPLSPYGLEKLVNDQYADLYHRLYGLSTLGLRYFNVYGPRQSADSAYSGVISKFAVSASGDGRYDIFGDGMQTRDFVYVKDIARANLAALESAACGVINIATGKSVTLLELVQCFASCTGTAAQIVHGAERPGDVPRSSVNPVRMMDELGIRKTVMLQDGLAELLAHLRGES